MASHVKLVILFITGSSSSLPAVHADDVGLGEDVVGAGEGGVDGGGHRVLALTPPPPPPPLPMSLSFFFV